MKKFITLITSAALAVTSLCAAMPAYAETDKADEAAGSEGFSYTVNDGSVVFTSTDDTYFVINSVTTEYDSGYRDDNGLNSSFVLTPEDESSFIVTAVTIPEKIIEYDITEDIKNSFSYYCPEFRTYTIDYDKSSGISVELIDDIDFNTFVDLDELTARYAERDLESYQSGDRAVFKPFTVVPFDDREILSTFYLSFIKNILKQPYYDSYYSEQIKGTPYFRHIDMFNDITDELVVNSDNDILFMFIKNGSEIDKDIAHYLDKRSAYTGYEKTPFDYLMSNDDIIYNTDNLDEKIHPTDDSFSMLYYHVFYDDITYTTYRVNPDITDDFVIVTNNDSFNYTQYNTNYINVSNGKFNGIVEPNGPVLPNPLPLPPPPPEGDVNYDYEVNIADLLWLEKYLSGRYDKGVYDIDPDINDDDKVNVFDLVVLRQLVMENITSQYAFSFRADVTDLADYKANEAAAAKMTYKLTSPTELSATLKPLFSETVLREMDKRYDKNFFQKNVLLLRLGTQTDNGYISKISGIKVSDENELDITIDRFDTNSDTADGIVLYQVSVPKADYSTLKNINWHEQIIDGPWIDPMKVVDIPLNTFSFGLYFPELYHELWGEKHKAYSLDEFTELLTTESGECYLPQINEKAATLNKTSADGEKITFDENLFKDNFVYFYVSTEPIDETYFCEYTEGNNTLTINSCSSLGFGDIVNEFLNVFVIPKTVDKDAEIVMDTHKQVNYRVITLKNRSSINDLGPFTTFVDSSKNYNRYINVCKHTFGDTSSVAFYTFQVPSLGVPANNSFLHELPIKEGTAPFACDKLIYDAPLSGDNYTITFDTTSGDIELTSDDFLEYRGYRLSYSGNYSIKEMFK